MAISIYAGVREHEGKSHPHRQYLRSEEANNLYARKKDLEVLGRSVALSVRSIPKTNDNGKGNGNGSQGPKGDKGDKGDQGDPGTTAPHTHPISEVVSLQSSLDGKAVSVHAHPISDVTNLQTSLDTKAASTHSHAISDVTNLQSSLDGKAASSHSHPIADVTNLQSSLDGKAASSHAHAQGDITGLVAALAGKSDTAHTHAGLPIMARIAADIAQSSNSTFSNLFTRAVLAGEIWSFEAIIYFTSAAATTGLVTQCDSPTSPTFGQCAMCAEENVTVGRYLPAAFNATMIATAAVITPAINTALVSGTLENGANVGNIVIKFRSEINGSAITVKRGSWCKFFKH